MTIIRTVHDKSNPYVMLNKYSLWDENLSLDAIGLWARLMSKPDNWTVRSCDIQKTCRIGEHKVRKILQELQDNGYCYRFQPKNGKFMSWETLIFETKKSKEEIQEILTLRGFTRAEIPQAENQALLSNDITNPSSLRSEVKEAASKPKKESAAAPSIEDQIKKSRIPKEEREAALSYFKANPKKFEEADNPIGLLISIVDSGDHKRAKPSSIPTANKEWMKKVLVEISCPSDFYIGEKSLFITLNAGMPDYSLNYDNPRFKEIISDRLKRAGIDINSLQLQEK